MATSITITKTGPLLDANVSNTLKRGIRAGIFDVASEVVGTVQEQLYRGHGWVIGNLRGSIGARQFSDLGYQMFQRAAVKWNSNRSRIAKIMLTQIRQALK